MKTIKDSVHDHITVSGIARALLDTPAMQRLRYIRQLGTVHFVYPSANHTRFEHSLGVYHLACAALAELGISGKAADHVSAAALLHDVGHAPFSHNLEPLLARRTGRYHDDVGTLLEEGRIADVLAEYGLDPDRIAALIAGEGRYGQLISGELDVDRLDYLVRDAHHTGVPYGTIDHARLVRELRFVEGELVLAPGNIETAESVLTARALMNPTVYNHHVARISKTMLRRATERLIEAGATDAESVHRMDDHDLVSALRREDSTASMARRLTERDLFKRAVWAEFDVVPEWVHDADHATLRSIESEIAEAVDTNPSMVLVDRPPEPTMRESTARVMVSDGIARLGDRSPLVRALRTIQRKQWRFGIYSPADRTERVADAAAEVLDVDRTLISPGDSTVGRPARLDRYHS